MVKNPPTSWRPGFSPWLRKIPWIFLLGESHGQRSLVEDSPWGSKWIKDLNVRPETIKLLEENIGKTLSEIHHSRILYDPPPRILEIKAKINGT